MPPEQADALHATPMLRWTRLIHGPRIRDQVAVVTGASKGIGLAVTQALADEGARVVAGARSDRRARRDRRRHAGRGRPRRSGGPGAPGRAGDRRARPGRRARQQRRRRPPAPRRLPRAAPTTTSVGAEPELLPDAARNPGGARRRWWTRATARSSTSCPSTRSSSPTARPIDYCAAKAAAANLTKSLAQEFGPARHSGQRVSPGPVETDLWLGDHGVAATVAEVTASTPTPRARMVAGIGGFATGRFTAPDEVADAGRHARLGRTGNVTGANIVIDGGLIKTL